MNLTVSMSGVSRVALKVKYLITAGSRGLREGSSEGAGIMRDEAQVLVPVDTGRLRDSIHIEHIVDTPERQVFVITPVTPAANEYGFEPPYARAVEFGYEGINKAGRHQHTPAQPYMRPAFDGKQSEARQAIKDGVYNALDEAMNRVASGRRK